MALKSSQPVMKLLGLILLVFLAACESDEPAPRPADTLLGDGNLPKVIVTVELPSTITPTLTDEQAAVVVSPTEPVRAGTPTATPTPYVGVFIGQPTSVDPEGNVVVPPTIPPLVLIQPGGNPGGVIAPAATSGFSQVSSGTVCSIPVAEVFQNAYNTNPALQSLGCPREAGYSLSLVFQPFEQGRMFWRDNGQLVVLSNSGVFWRVPDNWNESIPADDPSLIPPPGLIQPVRGFGFIWRTNETFKNSLGWAVASEFPISSYWQEFTGGSVFLGDGGLIFAITPSDTGQYIGGISQ